MCGLQLIAQDHPGSAGGDLVINVDAIGDQLPPVCEPILFDDEIDRVRSIPGFEDEMFVEIFVLRRGIFFEEPGELVHEKEFLFEIECQAAPTLDRSFKDHFAIAPEPGIKVSRRIGQRKKRSEPGATFDQAPADGNHGGEGENEGDFAALFEKDEGRRRANQQGNDSDLEQRPQREPSRGA